MSHKQETMKFNSYFENHKNIIEVELLKAEKQVIIAVAWINFKEYFQVFNELLNKNILLKIICTDNRQNRSHMVEIQKLISLGAEIKLLKMPRSTNHMHHKFAIIDSKTVLNGSFNWSPNATKSFENLTVATEVHYEASKFENEFVKLSTINVETIRGLQNKKRCVNNCGGELFNILVFSEHGSKYYEVFGDIIEFCNNCDYFEAIDKCLSESNLEITLQEYENAREETERHDLEKHLNDILNKYIVADITVHAIGRVITTYDGFDEEEVSIKVIWKNKFVGDRIPDTLEDQDFDVLYDN